MHGIGLAWRKCQTGLLGKRLKTMLSDRTFIAAGLAALVAAGLAATPALSGVSADATTRATALSSLVGRFTPAKRDPVLWARYTNLSEQSRRNFRFTPAMPRTENRAVTLVVRAPQRAVPTAIAAPTIQPVATIAPVSYRLGSAVGYTAFAAAITPTHVDISALPQARRPSDVPQGRPSRFGADMRLDARAQPGAVDPAMDSDRQYSVDVTGSYRVTRNVEMTAGLRLQRDNDRVAPAAITDQTRDSQAVYVGTRFRF